jgi:hypothetical protein
VNRTLGLAAALVLVGCREEFRFDALAAGLDAGADVTQVMPEDAAVTGAVLPCRGNGDCVLSTLRCDAKTGRCVDCLVDADCPQERPRCDGELRMCVECHGVSDCPSKHICELRGHVCQETCAEGNESCAAGAVCDEGRSRCIHCTKDAHCAASSAGARCDVATGNCVECRGNADCPTDKPACDRRPGRCVGCLDSSWCKGAGQVCEPKSRACVLPS